MRFVPAKFIGNVAPPRVARTGSRVRPCMIDPP